jgi:hypothetical protein
MKKGYLFICLPVLMLMAMLCNSCKKDTQGTVESLLARGTWQLASVMRFNYVGGTNTSTDTLNATCLLSQTFSFGSDNTCTYVNFSCINQNAKGQWTLSDDKLTLISSISCQDTLAGGKTTALPFQSARIVNLGQYSMVLETGDLSSYYLNTDKRHIKRYGFIRY